MGSSKRGHPLYGGPSVLQIPIKIGYKNQTFCHLFCRTYFFPVFDISNPIFFDLCMTNGKSGEKCNFVGDSVGLSLVRITTHFSKIL